MTTSFANKKALRFTITLAIGAFNGENNRVVLEGFRSIVDIQKAGGQMMSTCTAKIYGLDQAITSKLTTLAFLAMSYTKNTIQVDAIDGDSTSLVFIGQIINAWGDYSSAPDNFLYIETQAGFFDQLNITDPLAYDGVIDVAVMMQTLASRMSVAFENNGVTAKISKPNYHGTTIDQLRNLANDTHTDFYLDGNVLAICPQGLARTQGVAIIPQISDKTGLIGYPTFDKVGIIFKCLFNPNIRFGGQIQMQSDIPQANGTWQVCSVSYLLETEKPDGQWFMTVRCTGTGLVPL